MLHECFISESFLYFCSKTITSAATASLRLQKRCLRTTPCSGWTLCDVLALTVAFNSSHAESQEDNNAPVAAACHLVACILHNPKLTELDLGHQPSACIGHAAWQGEGLPVPPGEVAANGWTAVLEFLRKAKPAAADAK
jgi:hypothetical protein